MWDVASGKVRPRKALRGGIEGVFKSQSIEDLSCFGGTYLRNGSKNEPMAPTTNLGCPHEGPRVDLQHQETKIRRRNMSRIPREDMVAVLFSIWNVPPFPLVRRVFACIPSLFVEERRSDRATVEVHANRPCRRESISLSLSLHIYTSFSLPFYLTLSLSPSLPALVPVTVWPTNPQTLNHKPYTMNQKP